MLALFVIAKGIHQEKQVLSDVLDADLSMRYRFQQVLEHPGASRESCTCNATTITAIAVSPFTSSMSRRRPHGIVVEYKYCTRQLVTRLKTTDRASRVAGRTVPFTCDDVAYWRRARRADVATLASIQEESGLMCESCTARHFTIHANTISIPILPTRDRPL
ncbi:Aste57867_14957 [Aphanomyces stellatus]|uniref:Aste57867_14957 protein n=1 Tax=Aphanomyces stellatus TaxID=120398 RepID=A0A485L212_9STRA|nr:hypothetical protein As57867_014901 [Aphanomyces stellatus]VFT91771.1 Aste57867_14957 [Aphanomyces stellatus]